MSDLQRTEPLAAVIFDMDGVLIDSEPIHFEAIGALLTDHGVSSPAYHDESFFGCTAHEVFRTLRRRYQLVPTEDDLAAEWISRVVALLSRPLQPLPGVPGVLNDLRARGLRLALASGSAPSIVAATLAGLGLSQAFECMVSGHEVSRGKPAPDIFLETANRLGLPAAGCLVIEDSYNGLTAAVAAGMRCVAVPCASTAGQDFSAATVRLESLTRLPAWVDGLGG
jgi:HAD superfamily hydrolase (TIGR01509 family)